MKEVIFSLLIWVLTPIDTANVVRTPRIDTPVVVNADSAIAVELYKAKINLDRLAGR